MIFHDAWFCVEIFFLSHMISLDLITSLSGASILHPCRMGEDLSYASTQYTYMYLITSKTFHKFCIWDGRMGCTPGAGKEGFQPQITLVGHLDEKTALGNYMYL